MSDPRWTDYAERLVATALHQADCEWDLDTCLEDCTHSAATESILAALADAGLLLPPGGEVRTEDLHFSERVGRSYRWKPVHKVRTVTAWPDGSELAGPWQLAALDIPGSQT